MNPAASTPARLPDIVHPVLPSPQLLDLGYSVQLALTNGDAHEPDKRSPSGHTVAAFRLWGAVPSHFLALVCLHWGICLLLLLGF